MVDWSTPEGAYLAAVHRAITDGFLTRFGLTDDLLVEAAQEISAKLSDEGEWDAIASMLGGGDGDPSVVFAFLDLFPAEDRTEATRLLGVIVRSWGPTDVVARLDAIVVAVSA